ncbi:MAG: alkaline shock response membrane anchor protein AmaP [Eubacteriales bacterium]|nr:alkaline shock response membrane anchor protein AmaP [Eubacteriales bacterium]
MRLKLIDRILAAIAGLLILAIGIGLLVFGAGFFPFKLDLSILEQQYVFWQRAVMVAAALILCFIGLRGISMLFRSGREKGFIAQHTEYGDLSISMTAMENMVKRCVDSHSELKVSNTRIHHARDGVVVSIRISLANGVNIPITVSALQKQIKQYITSCSGVDVKEVRVMVETNNSVAPVSCEANGNTLLADVDAASKAGEVVNSLHETAQNAMPPEISEEEKPAREPLHQRLFKREEKPQIVPEPPTLETESETPVPMGPKPEAMASETVVTEPAEAPGETPEEAPTDEAEATVNEEKEAAIESEAEEEPKNDGTVMP